MESESQDTKTASRSSSTEDVVAVSRDDDQLEPDSKLPAPRRASFGDLDPDLEDFEPLQPDIPLPVHHSMDLSKDRPVYHVTPYVNDPKPAWVEEEVDIDTSQYPDVTRRHEDDSSDEFSLLIIDGNTDKADRLEASVQLTLDDSNDKPLTEDDYADRHDSDEEYLASAERKSRSPDEKLTYSSEEDESPRKPSRSTDFNFHKENESAIKQSSQRSDDSEDELKTPNQDQHESESRSSTQKVSASFKISQNSAFVPISPNISTTDKKEELAEDVEPVPIHLKAPQPETRRQGEEKIITTKHGLRIKVYVGDITKAQADAVVTSENRFSNDMSMVTRALCKVPGGPEFEEKRERRRLTQGTLGEGQVYTLHIKNKEFPFQYVLQAVISPIDLSRARPGTWMKILKRLYRNICKKADKKDLSTIAVPLLGTGRSPGSAEESIEAAARTLCKYRPLCLEEVQFVSLDRGINDYLAVICDSCCSISDDSDSEEEDSELADEDEVTQASKSADHAVSVTASHSKERGLVGSEPDNILLSPPVIGHPPSVAISSAASRNPHGRDRQQSEETSPQLTRAERLQKLMSNISKPEDTKASDDSDDIQNIIPEVKSTLNTSWVFDRDTETYLKKKTSVSVDSEELSENEPDNMIGKSRSNDFVDAGPVTDFDKSSKYDDNFPADNMRATSRQKQTSESKFQPNRDPDDDDFDDFTASRVYYGSGTKPGYWQQPFDNVAEYGSDDDDFGQKFAEVENEEFEITIGADLVQTGNQPTGTMSVATLGSSQLPGYEGVGTIVISYQIPSGVQTEEHPHPGRRYHGIHRRAFLPDNETGRMVMRMLKVAFERRLVFTVGRSLTTGAPDVVKWGPISHKTSQDGGPQRYGYPDIDYLNLVTNELLNLGIMDTASDVVDDMNSLVVNDND